MQLDSGLMGLMKRRYLRTAVESEVVAFLAGEAEGGAGPVRTERPVRYVDVDLPDLPSAESQSGESLGGALFPSTPVMTMAAESDVTPPKPAAPAPSIPSPVESAPPSPRKPDVPSPPKAAAPNPPLAAAPNPPEPAPPSPPKPAAPVEVPPPVMAAPSAIYPCHRPSFHRSPRKRWVPPVSSPFRVRFPFSHDLSKTCISKSRSRGRVDAGDCDQSVVCLGGPSSTRPSGWGNAGQTRGDQEDAAIRDTPARMAEACGLVGKGTVRVLVVPVQMLAPRKKAESAVPDPQPVPEQEASGAASAPDGEEAAKKVWIPNTMVEGKLTSAADVAYEIERLREVTSSEPSIRKGAPSPVLIAILEASQRDAKEQGALAGLIVFENWGASWQGSALAACGDSRYCGPCCE